MEQEDKKQIESFDDEWLTDALRARTQTEARPGLEERVLARLAGEQLVSSQRKWRWMPALAFAFGLLLIVLLGRQLLQVRRYAPDQKTKIVQPQQVRPLSPISQPPKVQIAKSQSDIAKRFSRAHRRSSAGTVLGKLNVLPKLDKFPAEIPASEQERLMADMQRRRSAAALAQYARDFREGKDLLIENNSIPPLSPETADEKPNR